MAQIDVVCGVCSGTGFRSTGGSPENCYSCGGSGKVSSAAVDISALESKAQEVLDVCTKILQIVDKGK
jgi:DnaJ-class molecular chaperone